MSERRSTHKATHNAGAFLGPNGTFPAAMHTLSDEVPKRPTELGAEKTGHLADVDAPERQGSQRSTLEAVGWATGIAVATWALGSIVVAIGIGAILALSGASKPSDEAAVALGLVDLLLIAPGIYLGARAQRLGFGWSWLVIGAGASLVAVVATLVPTLTPFVLAGSLAILVAWRLDRRRQPRGSFVT